MTQLERARENEVTPEMKFIAERENLSEDVVRSEVARGRMVIPVGKQDVQQMKVIVRLEDEVFEENTYGDFKFVPMIKNIKN